MVSDDESQTTDETIAIPRDLFIRVYKFLDWICSERLRPWPPEVAPDPGDLYMEMGAIVNRDGEDARDVS